MVNKDNKVVTQLLIQWMHGTTEDSTWEDYLVFVERCPDFIPEDKD